MMSYTHYREKEPAGVTEMIHRKGYDYQWKMLLNELHAQMKMEHKDITGFAERNRWFNRDVVLAIASDYVNALKKHVGNLETRKCKEFPTSVYTAVIFSWRTCNPNCTTRFPSR